MLETYVDFIRAPLKLISASAKTHGGGDWGIGIEGDGPMGGGGDGEGGGGKEGGGGGGEGWGGGIGDPTGPL